MARQAQRAERTKLVVSRPMPGQAFVDDVPEREPLVTMSFQWAKPGKDMCLSRCTTEQVCAVIDCLRMMSSLTWTGVFGLKGLDYKNIEDDALSFQRPASVDKAVPISQVRFSGKGRIYGANHGGVFHLIRFDPDHDGTGR